MKKKKIKIICAAVVLLGIVTGVIIMSKEKKDIDDGVLDETTKITNLTVGYMENPLGISSDGVSFSWKMASKLVGQSQKAYEISVTKEDGTQVWNSGKVNTDKSVGIGYAGNELEASTRYNWEVKVWATKGGYCTSEKMFFETGITGEEVWEETPFISLSSATDIAPIFRTEQAMQGDKKVKQARLYITSIGVYKAYVNGETVGKEDYMTPGYGDGSRSIAYQTYDVTDMLTNQTDIAITVVVGTGWSNSQGSDVAGGTTNKVAVKALMIVEYEDGSVQNITTDTQNWWATLSGPVTASGIFYGEDYDAGREILLGDYKQVGYTYNELWINSKEKTGGSQVYMISNEFDLVKTKHLRISVKQTGPATADDRENRLQIMELIGYNDAGENVLSEKKARISNNNELANYGWSANHLTDGDTGEVSGKGYTSEILGTDGKEEFDLDKPITIDFAFEKETSLKELVFYGRTGKTSVVSGVCPNYPKIYSIQISDDGNNWTDIVSDYEVGLLENGNDDISSMYLTTINYVGKIKEDPASTGKIIDGFSKDAVNVVTYSGYKENSEYVGGEIEVDNEYSGRDIFRDGIALKSGQTMIINMGQNMTAIPYIKISGAKGESVTIRFGEMLNDGSSVTKEFVSGSHNASGPKGTLYTHSLRTARSSVCYTFGSDDIEEYQTTMSFFGYQYIEITATTDIVIYDICSKAVSSLTQQSGYIETNNSDVNKLFSNVLYGQLSNYFTMITDCPQRDERKGWTGDAQVFAQTGLYNFNALAFQNSYQNKLSASTKSKGYASAVLSGWDFFSNWASGWSDVEIINVWTMYKQTGDISIVKTNWEAMNTYMEYLKKHERKDYMAPRQDTTGYGDWLAFQGTGYEVIADYYYGYVNMLMGKMAEIVDDGDKETYYNDYFEKLKETFLDTHVVYNGDKNLLIKSGTGSSVMQNKGGVKEDNSQTALLWMLKLGYYTDDNMRDEAIRLLVENIKNVNPSETSIRSKYGENSLSVGFLGVNVIAPVLSDNGYSDVAYDLLLNTQCPSWLFEVKQGATTIWERWDSYSVEDGFGDCEMNSFNHFSYGAVVEWMYKYMAGICADEADAGFKHIILQPTIDKGIKYNDEDRISNVKASYESYYGTIVSNWIAENGKIKSYHVEIPANTTATVYLPVEEMEIQNVDSVEYIGITEHNGERVAEFSIVSGGYDFVVEDGKMVVKVTEGYY